jgi:purine-cytosine permease-like protein
MASDDEPRGDDAADGVPPMGDHFSEPVQRRSTYTPPTGVPAPVEEPTPDVVDDDALAAAMEDQWRTVTGVNPVIYSLDDVPTSDDEVDDPAPPVFPEFPSEATFGAPFAPPPPPDEPDLPSFPQPFATVADEPAPGAAPYSPPPFSTPSASDFASIFGQPAPADPPPPVFPHDADALAAALDAAPPPAPPVVPGADASSAPDPVATSSSPVSPVSAEAPPAPQPAPAPETPAFDWGARYSDGFSAAETPSTGAPQAGQSTSAAAPPPFVAPAAPAPAAFASAEEQAAFLAAQAGPAGEPWVPHRRSLPDDVLARELTAAAADPERAGEVIAELQRQLRLREDEAREFKDWEDSMLTVGTPEALATIAEVRREFAGVVDGGPEPVPEPSQDEVEAPTADGAMDGAPDPLATAEPFDASMWGPPTPTVDSGPPPLIEPPAPEPASWTPPPFADAPETLTSPEVPTSEAARATDEDPFGFGLPASEPTADIEEVPVEDTLDPFADLPSAVDPGDDREDVAPIAFVEPTPLLVVPTSIPMPFEALLHEEPPTPSESATQYVTSPPADLADMQALFGSPGAAAEGEATTVAESEQTLEAAADEFGIEPTAADLRVSRAVSLFWIWFAPNSSLLTIALGGLLFSLGMSLRQAVIAALAGVVLSFIPLGLGTLAGRRSGQPTMIVSRATFGVVGNVVPALVALVSRVFWGGALLWMLGASVASVLVGAGFSGGLGASQLTIICLGAGFLVALVIAFLGYTVIARFQLVVTIIAIVLVGGLILLTRDYVHLGAALAIPDGDLTVIVTGGVLVFSVVGVVWANGTSDLARYQRPGGTGAAPMLFASFGAALPAFALVAYGALLAASNPDVAAGLLSDPVDTLGRMLPSWYPLPLILGVALSLVSGVVVSIYSGSFALASLGARVRRPVATLLIAALVLAAGAGVAVVQGDLVSLLRDAATTIGVPVAAWAGMFSTEVMLRNRPYHAASLLRRGGAYPDVRWAALISYLVICIIGLGFVTATAAGLTWEGYGFSLLGVPVDSGFGATDLGVVLALVLGLVAPLGVSISAIRRQEQSVAEGPLTAQ